MRGLTLRTNNAPSLTGARIRPTSMGSIKWYCVFVLCFLPAVASVGCKVVDTNDVNDRLLPSNFRDWSPEFAVLPYAEFDGDQVTVRNIRNNQYLSNDDFVVDRYDQVFDLSEIESVEFFVVPFAGYEFMAHTMLSFGFKDGKHLAVSAEIRTEKGETYSPIAGLARQYELTYVVADERDLVLLRTHHRDADVYLYRTMASPEQARELFVDVMQRVNRLAANPEFYDTVTNNCTTNIVSHVNRILPNRVPYSVEVLLPGFSDRYAYDLGLLDQRVPFESLKRRAWINDLAAAAHDDPDFSTKIRQRQQANESDARSQPQPTTKPDEESQEVAGLLDLLFGSTGRFR